MWVSKGPPRAREGKCKIKHIRKINTPSFTMPDTQTMGMFQGDSPRVPRWRNGPSGVPAGGFQLLKVPTQGPENILHLCLALPVIPPRSPPEGELCFPALWRRLCLAPSSKSTWMGQEHPTRPLQVRLCQAGPHVPAPPEQNSPALLLSWARQLTGTAEHLPVQGHLLSSQSLHSKSCRKSIPRNRPATSAESCRL